MPQYSFRCIACGNSFTVTSREHIPPCPTCGASSPKRNWSFNTGRSFPEHFNHSVGEYVNSKREFYDGLKRQSEIASIRTGVTHDFQPIDPSDMRDASAHGVTEEGLDATRAATFIKD